MINSRFRRGDFSGSSDTSDLKKWFRQSPSVIGLTLGLVGPMSVGYKV